MLKKVLLKILFSFPFLKKNVIILENNPDFDGSPMKVERDLKKKFLKGSFCLFGLSISIVLFTLKKKQLPFGAASL